MPAIHIKHLKIGHDAIEHSSAQGWSMERYLQSGSSWYVKSHFIDYLKPTLLGDQIIICTWVSGMFERNSPRQTLFLRADDRQILARAETQWIFVSLRNGRPVAIPEKLRNAFDIVTSETDALLELNAALKTAPPCV